jgi:cellulose/xylan binding protein with CBM9 domain
MNKQIQRKKRTCGLTIAPHFGIAAVLFTFCCSFARQASGHYFQIYSSDNKITAERRPAEFTLDGKLEKPAWRHARWAEFDHDASGKSHDPALRTRVACVWTSVNLYVAFSAHFDSLNFYDGEQPAAERWQLWERDVVEVFVNPQPERINHYYEFEVAPNNQWIDLEIDKNKTPFNDASWDSHFDHATYVDPQKKVWSTEMRIPLAPMKVDSIQPGAQWRVNFFRAAGHGDDRQRKFLAWSIIPEGKTFHVPARFGILSFVN